jgi:hypothetical protein
MGVPAHFGEWLARSVSPRTTLWFPEGGEKMMRGAIPTPWVSLGAARVRGILAASKSLLRRATLTNHSLHFSLANHSVPDFVLRSCSFPSPLLLPAAECFASRRSGPQSLGRSKGPRVWDDEQAAGLAAIRLGKVAASKRGSHAAEKPPKFVFSVIVAQQSARFKEAGSRWSGNAREFHGCP